MTKFTIELEDTYNVTMRNGASITVETSKLLAKADVASFVVEYGIGQVHRDSASGATKAAEAEGSKGVQAEAQAMMEAKYAALCEGVMTRRGDGTGVDPRVAVQRSVTRQAMKAALGSKSPEWAKFTGLSDADQLAKLDENYAANEAILADAVDKELARRADAQKAKAKLAKAATFAI
jgi:hypothetical protein